MAEKDNGESMTDNNDEIYKVENDLIKDERTFTQKAFFNIDGTLKKIVVVDCVDGNPESFPTDRIMLMKNYKSGIERGRKDPLKGRDVLVFLTDKGPYVIPLDEAENFAAYMYSVAKSIKKKISN